ncbi:restriction endonuclease subunit S [Salinimicrobium sp. MT39]|uniref:Restriction endonuclease subunit S n=2 Tax=Salinimicrobium profundisediminis TaxID=2994553 RepID=A0A9X3CYQ6_9FLAO|nr:restriction endonuclease subunit S [Salinimicrobium profundisediminis]
MKHMPTETTFKYLNEVRFMTLSNWSVGAILSDKVLYKDGFKLEPIGNLIIRNREKEILEDDKAYKQVTIKLYGKGVIQRGDELIFGKNIGTKNQFRISEGQFIMSKIDARNGAFGIVPPELEGAITTQDFLSYNINTEKILPEFFNLITGTKHFAELCQKASSGTTGRQRVDEKAFLGFRIPVPQIEIQKEIVKQYRNNVEEEIQLQSTLIALKDEIDLYLNDKLGITSYNSQEPTKRFNVVSFSSLSEWGINSPMARMRNFYSNLKFRTLPISALCKISSGGTPSRSNKQYYGGEIPWIKTGEVRENIITETEEYITELGLKRSSAKLYPKGSLIVAMYGATAGRSAKLGIDATTNQACAVLHNINAELILTDFLWIYLISQIENFRLLASGSAQPNLNASKVANYLVPIPTISEQKQILDDINVIKDKISRLETEIERVSEQTKSQFESAIFNID